MKDINATIARYANTLKGNARADFDQLPFEIKSAIAGVIVTNFDTKGRGSEFTNSPAHGSRKYRW